MIASMILAFQQENDNQLDSLLQQINSLEEKLRTETDSLKVAELCYEIYRVNTFELRRDLEETPNYLFRALNIYEQSDEFGLLAGVYNALGGYYFNRGIMDLARDNWIKGKQAYEKASDSLGIAKSLNNMSLTYADTHENRLAFILQSIDISEQIGDSTILVSALTNLAEYYRLQYDFEKSEAYIRNVISISGKIEKFSAVQAGYVHLGRLKRDQGKAEEAISYLERSLSFNEIRSTDPNVVNAYDLLAQLYKTVGNLQKALYYQELLLKVKDELFDKKVSEQLFELTRAYEIQKKELTIEAQQSQLDLAAKKNQLQNQWIAFIIILFMISLLLIYLWNSWKISRNREQLRQGFAHDLINNIEGERKRISSDLHDSIGQQLILLKNQASVKGERAMVTSIGETLEDVRRISRDLQPALLDKMGLKAALEELINKLDETTDIFFSTEFNELEFGELFSGQEKLNIYRIIQEAMSNILKHAQATSVKLSTYKESSFIVFSIQDNGQGFSAETKQTNTLGLKTMSERASMLKAKFTIESNEKGILVMLKIPR